MKRILCYGDSNTWGYDPEQTAVLGTAARFPEDIRWTGVMQQRLGPEYRVLEEGYNGRTTVFEDPTAYGRNGLTHLEVALGSCLPVDCVILMLGTNDLKDLFSASAQVITDGMARLIRTCRNVLADSCSPKAKILVAAPVNVAADQNGEYQYGFSPLSTEKGALLRCCYGQLAKDTGCAFLDAGAYTRAGKTDGVHLDADGHRALAAAMTAAVLELLEK